MAVPSVIQQYVYETDNWECLLTFFIQENVSFKTRLAEVVDVILDNEDLAIVEKFHEDFLSQDRIISFLSYELHKQKKMLERNLNEDEALFKEVIINHEKLRSEIKKAEQMFNKMKQEFLDYLSVKF